MNNPLEEIYKHLNKILPVAYNQASTRAQLGVTNSNRIKDNVWGADDRSQKLFWDWLVEAGWRQNIVHADGYDGAVTVVLSHEKCGRIMETRMLHSLDQRTAEYISSKEYITKCIAKHKTSKKDCVKKEEEED